MKVNETKVVDFLILKKPLFRIVEVDLNEHLGSKGKEILPNLSLYEIEDIHIENVQSIDKEKPGYMICNDGTLEIPLKLELDKNKKSFFETERSARQMASDLNQQSMEVVKTYQEKAQNSMSIIDKVEEINRKKISSLSTEEE